MLRQTVVLQRRTAKLFNDTSKALHKRIHIFRLCLIHPHYVRCCFMAPIRPFTSCRTQVPCVHKSFKTVSQLLENPYLYFCLANAGSPSQFACYPKAVRTGAPPKIKHRTPPPCVRPGPLRASSFLLGPLVRTGLFLFLGMGRGEPLQKAFATSAHHKWCANADRNRATVPLQKIARIAVRASQRPQPHRIGFVAQRHARKSPKRRPAGFIIPTTRC